MSLSLLLKLVFIFDWKLWIVAARCDIACSIPGLLGWAQLVQSWGGKCVQGEVTEYYVIELQ